jgi:hypothetical protein
MTRLFATGFWLCWSSRRQGGRDRRVRLEAAAERVGAQRRREAQPTPQYHYELMQLLIRPEHSAPVPTLSAKNAERMGHPIRSIFGPEQ